MSNSNIDNQPALSQQLAELDWDVQPDRDLWPDIHSRIRFADRQRAHESAKSRPWVPFAVAASTVFATVSLLFSSMMFKVANDTKRAQEAMVVYQQAQLNLIEEQHQMVRVQFVQLLQNQREPLNPELVVEMQKLMAQVDAASAEIKQAMQAQPNNPDYASMLVQTYQQEIKQLNRLKSRTGVSI